MNKFIFAFVIVILFSSCLTAKITDDMSAAEIMQRAQEAMDRNSYNVAAQYYRVLHERNQTNIDLVITAEYHLAFIHYKQGRYEQAREELNKVLGYYNSRDQELLPQHFKRLAQVVLESITEKEKRWSLFRK
ncbi:MAG: hypothetical protein FWD28_10170 [Treponema sp.]|nr:hypothetical protein [Treponema sp.]